MAEPKYTHAPDCPCDVCVKDRHGFCVFLRWVVGLGVGGFIALTALGLILQAID